MWYCKLLDGITKPIIQAGGKGAMVPLQITLLILRLFHNKFSELFMSDEVEFI